MKKQICSCLAALLLLLCNGAWAAEAGSSEPQVEAVQAEEQIALAEDKVKKEKLAEKKEEAKAEAVPEAEGNVPEKDDSAKEAAEPVQPVKTAVVLIMSQYSCEPGMYFDIVNRNLVRCYSQYRYPTSFGPETQLYFNDAMFQRQRTEEPQWQDGDNLLAQMVIDMGQDQILYLRSYDVVRRQMRNFGWRWGGSETTWEAVVEVEAIYATREGIQKREKFHYRVDEKYSVQAAVFEAYTHCIREIQQRKYFC